MPERPPHSNVRRDPEHLLGVALELSACGWRVFPVADKRPLITGFHGSYPFAADALRAMPWGKATHIGWSLPPNFIGLDVDVRRSGPMPKIGDIELAALERELGVLPASFKQCTPSGGFHLVFGCRAFKWLPKRLWNSEGADCDIDIAINEKLMLVHYDPDALLTHPIEELPIAWDRYLRKPPSGSLDAIAEAPVGTRNSTLNSEAFKFVVRDGTSPALRSQLLEAAAQAGIPVREAEDTINSAFNAAETQRLRAEHWLRAIACDGAISKLRNKRRILAAAQEFKKLHLRTGRNVIGMSSRELAEKIGCQQRAASSILRVLVEAGHLQPFRRMNATDAKQYKLLLPKTSNSQLTHPEGDFRVSRDLHDFPERLQKILQHDVFRRVGNAGWLAQSVGVVLHHPEVHGDCPARGFVAQLPLSSTTVRKALKDLRKHLLVADGVIRLIDPVDEILDGFAKEFGAVGRTDALVAKHEEQRQQRNAYLARKEVHKGQGKASSAG